jgi:SAM-dependent methyltransferase
VGAGRPVSGRVANPLELDSHGVWAGSGRGVFPYSDGVLSERYLRRVFSSSHDLSSTSVELEKRIRDWPSRYHLSPKRSQLLRPFEFAQSSRVLEIGCGCGAITRYLGEVFGDVVAVEGSLNRARLARQRTRDLEHVSIVCAPFQELRFNERFDLVFCIGVLEYAGAFLQAQDPFDTALAFVADVLAPGGAVVLAIENQFGLKYLTSSAEDHTGVMFDGWEGYPEGPNRVRTFGYGELHDLLKKRFSNVRFYYPYPDYKLPSCVLAEPFFDAAKVGELIAGCRAEAEHGKASMFDEGLALLELDRNDALPFFANSFLVIASNSSDPPVKFPHLGIKYSADRVPQLRSLTRFEQASDGAIWVRKVLLSGAKSAKAGPLTLHPTEDRWVRGASLYTTVRGRLQRKDLSLEEIFAPCRPWLTKLKRMAHPEGDRSLLDGRLLDANWTNCYVSGDDCVFIDLEWEWESKVSLNAILIRNIHTLLRDSAHLQRLHRALKRGNLRSIITRVAETLGVRLAPADFREFCRLEASLVHVAFGKNLVWGQMTIRLALAARWPFAVVRSVRRMRDTVRSKTRSAIERFFRWA